LQQTVNLARYQAKSHRRVHLGQRLRHFPNGVLAEFLERKTRHDLLQQIAEILGGSDSQ
jgi:hypothetical protein